MRRLLALLVLLSMAGPAGAVPLDFRTMPGGSEIYEITDGGERLLTRTASGRFGAVSLDVDPAGPHRYRLHRAPFLDRTLAVTWDRSLRQWRRTDEVGGTLHAGETLPFDRAIRFNVEPPPLAVYVDSEAGGDSSNALALPVDGTIHHVIPIQGSLRDHSFKIPAAYDPPRLYLTVPGRPPLPVRFREGELDSLIEKLPVEPLDWPARPVPAWAWAFGGGALVALAGLAWQRKRPTPSPRVERDTPATVATDVEEVRPFPRLEGTRLRSDGGEDFMVVRPVGKGGMGAVYEAVSLTRTDDPHWAIKVVHADIAASEEYRERFRREVTVCATLDHPGVVKVLDWGLYRANDADWPFMVMELVRGRDLRAILSAGRISDRQAVEWTIEALQALHVVHRRGIIHRDLKPENIMITKSGHVKLMDFGVARQSAPSTLTGTDTAIGTPMYMSPEHLNAKTVTPASDIYSMGIVLFELLSGRVPFEGDEMMIVIVKKLHGESLPLAALRPDLPGRLIEVVERMIARDPADRHPDCRSVIQALDQAGGR